MRYTLAPGASESWSPTLKAQKRRTSFEEGKSSERSEISESSESSESFKSSGSFESSDSIYSASCNLRIGTVKYKQGKFPMVPKNSHDLSKFPWSQKIPTVSKFPQSPTPYRIDYIAWQFP